MIIFPALKQKETTRTKIERQKMNNQNEKENKNCLPGTAYLSESDKQHTLANIYSYIGQ